MSIVFASILAVFGLCIIAGVGIYFAITIE